MRTTKADPLQKLADTLENSFGLETTLKTTTNNLNNKPINNRIHSLERIITVVQKMIDDPELIEPKKNQNKKIVKVV